MRTISQEETRIPEEDVGAFGARLAGTLIRPGDAAYEEARSIWNGMIDRRPALIARCLGTSDVIEAVRFARRHELLTSIRSGGHNIAGQAICEDGLVIDLSAMRGAIVDAERQSVHAQAGCLLGDVDRETQLHGRAAVLGFVSTTGAAGVTLGGGFGYLTRQHGWTCDNVRSMRVVTAEGELVRAGVDENEDLFWALRGGGGNFGIVTSFEHATHPVGPEIVGGAIAWRGGEAPAVFERFREVAAAAPPEMTCVFGLRKAPPAPWIDKAFHGEPIALVIVCHTGDREQALKDVAPLKEFLSPVGDVLIPRPYLQQQSLLDATQPKGRRYYWKSDYLPALREEMGTALVEHAASNPSPHTAILLFQLSGALNRLPEDHCAAGARDTEWVVNYAGSWERSEDDAENVAWARAGWEDMRRFSTGAAYVNFMTEDEGADRLAQAYGANQARLAHVKSRWDPDNFFRHNKNIPPA